MTPSLSAFLQSIFLAVFIVIIPIAAALAFVGSSDRIIFYNKINSILGGFIVLLQVVLLFLTLYDLTH